MYSVQCVGSGIVGANISDSLHSPVYYFPATLRYVVLNLVIALMW